MKLETLEKAEQLQRKIRATEVDLEAIQDVIERLKDKTMDSSCITLSVNNRHIGIRTMIDIPHDTVDVVLDAIQLSINDSLQAAKIEFEKL